MFDHFALFIILCFFQSFESSFEFKTKIEKNMHHSNNGKNYSSYWQKSKSGTSNNVIMIYRLSDGIHRDPGLHERRNIVMHTA